MIMKQKSDLRSLYFEYQKLEAGILLPDGRFASNLSVRRFINSQLLIDLFTIVDKAINHQLNLWNIERVRGVSPLTLLEQAGRMKGSKKLMWYKDWRNEAAHQLVKIEEYRLRQASDDVKFQLVELGLVDNITMRPYSRQLNNETYEYGAFVHDVPVLLHEILFRGSDGTSDRGCTWQESLNLTYEQFKTLTLQPDGKERN
jgi:hypothetical protein